MIGWTGGSLKILWRLNFKFPPSISSVIMHGITSTSISILWNGSVMPCFSPKRGLRQGDPLSPYLFVLCMERLGNLITREVQLEKWVPLSLSKGGPKISHLFFADDVLLFAKARPSQARLVANVLDEFCAISGMKVSLDKSRALASKGVTQARKNKLQGITQIAFTSNLGKYLGFKIFHERPKKEDFADIIGRVESKLVAWKGKLLNKSGRLTLAKSVLASTPSYGMQLLWYPQHLCDYLDRTVRSFVWKGTTDRGCIWSIGMRLQNPPRGEGSASVRRDNKTSRYLASWLQSWLIIHRNSGPRS